MTGWSLFTHHPGQKLLWMPWLMKLRRLFGSPLSSCRIHFYNINTLQLTVVHQDWCGIAFNCLASLSGKQGRSNTSLICNRSVNGRESDSPVTDKLWAWEVGNGMLDYVGSWVAQGREIKIGGPPTTQTPPARNLRDISFISPLVNLTLRGSQHSITHFHFSSGHCKRIPCWADVQSLVFLHNWGISQTRYRPLPHLWMGQFFCFHHPQEPARLLLNKLISPEMAIPWETILLHLRTSMLRGSKTKLFRSKKGQYNKHWMGLLQGYSLFIFDWIKTRVTDSDLEFKAHDGIAGALCAALATHRLATFPAVMLDESIENKTTVVSGEMEGFQRFSVMGPAVHPFSMLLTKWDKEKDAGSRSTTCTISFWSAQSSLRGFPWVSWLGEDHPSFVQRLGQLQVNLSWALDVTCTAPCKQDNCSVAHMSSLPLNYRHAMEINILFLFLPRVLRMWSMRRQCYAKTSPPTAAEVGAGSIPSAVSSGAHISSSILPTGSDV